METIVIKTRISSPDIKAKIVTRDLWNQWKWNQKSDNIHTYIPYIRTYTSRCVQ